MNTIDTPTTRPLAERITQGPIEATLPPAANVEVFRFVLARHGFKLAGVSNWPGGDKDTAGEAKANAELIAEAFHVTHETGRTPRQLADERAELIAEFQALAAQYDFTDCVEVSQQIREILNRFNS